MDPLDLCVSLLWHNKLENTAKEYNMSDLKKFIMFSDIIGDHG